MIETEGKTRKRNPRETAGILSLLSFAYIIDLVKSGYKKDLREEDLYEVTKNCESAHCGDRLENVWTKGCRLGKYPSLFITLSKVFGWKYLLWGLAQLIFESIGSILEPAAVTDLVSYFQPGQTVLTKTDAYISVATILSNNLLRNIFFHNFDLFLFIIGIEVRTSLCTLLFRKVLKLGPSATSKANLGNLVTLITKDVQQIKRTMFAFNDLWVLTLVCLAISYLLYSRMGAISLVATSLYICIIPLELFIGKLINKLRTETSQRTDDRLQITQEVLSATKIIKMYTWEDYFYRSINAFRKKEIAKMIFVFYLRIILLLLGAVVSKIGLYLLITAYIWMEQPPDASIVFFISSHLESLNLLLGTVLPESVGKFAEFTVTLKRIRNVLTAEEISHTVESFGKASATPLVDLKEITVSIAGISVLSNITFQIDKGLTVLTGKVGSGKSVLLKSILQEYPITKGKIVCKGTISYASQDPWCFPSTIKENILFGETFDEERYKEVIKVCALEYDLSFLGNGDQTILTDNGQNLSKGQQARINLARAIYKQSDIYLLDDCLAALDIHVHHFIFNHCIKRFLRNKICMLVSQSTYSIQNADNVFVMKEGQIVHSYTSKEEGSVINQDQNLSVIVSQTKQFIAIEKCETNYVDSNQLLETEPPAYKNIYEENLKKGAVSKKMYKMYVEYGGGKLLLLTVLLLIGSKQGAESYSHKLLSTWSDEKQHLLNIKLNITDNTIQARYTFHPTEEDANSTFTMYTTVLAVAVFLELVKTFAFLHFCKRASINIHKAMVRNVLHSVMEFFDTHFIGNVLNRFSQDVVHVDENLPFQLLNCLGATIHVAGAVVLIMLVNSLFSIFVIITFAVMILLLKLYLPVARSLQRVESSTRSPMIGHLNAALEGLTTIRACKAEQMVIDQYERHQNVFTSAHYSLLCYHFGMGFFMSLVACVMVVLVVSSFVLFDIDATAGSIGLAITQVLALGGLIQRSVKSWADLENLMTATERALEYTLLKTELNEGSIPKDWPNKGTVYYENVSLSYTRNQLILKDLNFEIGSKQKIGVVGRTGAGKSSIISTMFRLYETEGKILIDGMDIATIPLKFLRQSLAIIPQDPVIFSGTIRSNLDPFNEFNDQALWTALEKVYLKSIVSKLDCQISRNLSLGQKQMMCLARAILRKSKIVILDEATANMDHETGAVIQDVINENFVDCTVITIAHKLQSTLQCDKIMVLDQGQIVEFEDPKILLQNKTSMFYTMVKQGEMSN